MKMQTHSENSQRDLTNFINQENIKKEQIVNIYQSNDGLFTVNYFVED